MTTITKNIKAGIKPFVDNDGSGRIVIGLHQFEASMRRNESMFKAAFGNSTVGASIVDMQGRFVAANDAFERIVGYSHDELTEMTFLTITHPDDRQMNSSVLERTIKLGEPGFTLEKRYCHKDGRVIWVKTSISLINDETKKPEFALALIEDITARKDAQRAQQIAEEHTASLLNFGSALGEAITSTQVVNVILNSALITLKADAGLVCLVTDVKKELRLAKSVGLPTDIATKWNSIFQHENHPLNRAIRQRKLLVADYSDDVVIQHPELFSLYESPEHVFLCLPLLIGERSVGCVGIFCSSNHFCSVEQKVFLWAMAGQCAQAIERAQLYDAARREVEDRLRAEEAKRESEAKFFTIVDSSSVSYAVCDSGNFTFFNAEFTKTFGYDIEDIPTMERWWQTAYPDPDYRSWIVAEAARMAEKHKLDGLPFDSTEVTIRCKDGTMRTVIGNARTLGSAFPNIYVITFNDITERKLVEREKERLLLEAEERADRDPLTGLLNHRAFYNRLDMEAARSRRDSTSIAIVMLDLDNFKFFNDIYGHATGDEVLQKVALKLQGISRPYDTIARFGGDEFALLLPGISEASVEEIEARLRADLQGLVYHVKYEDTAIPVSTSLGAAIFGDNDADCRVVLRQADERLRWSKTGGELEASAQRIRIDAGKRVSGFSMLDALVTAVDNKDRYTRKHSEDVMEYSLMIYRELGCSEAEQQTAAVAALLHDVGKIGVPDAILRKPGKLTNAEFEAVKQHPEMGAVMIGSVAGLEDTLDAVRHHHERWDGKGYPGGLKGHETPFIARVMAVADAFSAMTTDRPYRKGMDRSKALSIIAVGAGTQWDPLCVEAFLNSWKRLTRSDIAA